MSTATVLPYSFGAVFGLAEGRCVVFGMLLFLLPTDRYTVSAVVLAKLAGCLQWQDGSELAKLGFAGRGQRKLVVSRRCMRFEACKVGRRSLASLLVLCVVCTRVGCGEVRCVYGFDKSRDGEKDKTEESMML